MFSKKKEYFISISIISSAVFISGCLIYVYLFSPTTRLESDKAISKQTILSGFNWSEQPQTLILVLQTSCHFCDESAPFYKRLIKKMEGRNIKFIAVLPTDIEKSRQHLNKLELNNIEVKQASLDSLQVNGTPTLILVNNKGEITSSWVGKLPPNKEDEVTSKLTSGE